MKRVVSASFGVLFLTNVAVGAAATGCQQFTGTWSGDCTMTFSDGIPDTLYQTKTTIAMSKDCQTLTRDGHTYRIGVPKTLPAVRKKLPSGLYQDYTMVSEYDWRRSGAVLWSNDVDFTRVYGWKKSAPEKVRRKYLQDSIYKTLATTTFEVEDGELLIEASIDEVSVQLVSKISRPRHRTMTCELTRE